LVAEVNPGTPAEKAGLKRGDIITDFNGTPIKHMNELPRLVANTQPGTKASVTVLREGKEKTFSLTVTELKEERQAMAAGESEEENSVGLVVESLNAELARRFGLKETKGVVVMRVIPGSAAAEAGLRPGDVILEVNGQTLQSVSDYQRHTKRLQPGAYARLLIKRSGHTLYITMEIPKK
jgi:serine protease Do